MDIYLLQTISLILVTAVIVLLIFNKLKIPSMIGLFLTGIILGQVINSTDIITSISELGVIFLLFIVGLEFSIEKFSSIKKYALLGGIFQVLITTVIVTVIFTLLKYPLNTSIFMGFLLCFSSTAIVIKLLQKKHLTHTVQGRVTLGILIFQDIAVIIVLLLTPLLGGNSVDFSTLPMTLFKLAVLTVILLLGAFVLVPWILHEASRTKNRDLFVLITLFVCLGTTAATSSLGISPELGAFIAGLIISNTDYSHQTLGYIQPFQDVFMSIFLISIGLMINVNYFINNILLIILLALIVLIVKFIATFLTGRVLKLPLGTIMGISIILTQIGEFSFVLASEGLKYGLINNQTFTAFLAVSIITMSATPFLQNLTPKLTALFKKVPRFEVDDNLKTLHKGLNIKELEDHIILVGFGINGQNMAKASDNYDIPYVIVDMNPVIVKNKKEEGYPIIYGDASNYEVLKELKITDAKCIVIATSNYASSLKTVDAARKLNPEIHIIVRTRYVKNVDELYDTGADEVIPEEYETSIVMFARVMDCYNKDPDEILETIDNLRSDSYNTFRSLTPEEIKASLSDKITDLDVDSIHVDDIKNINEYPFAEYNLTVTSIIRNNETITDIPDNYELTYDDLIVFTGNPDDIKNFEKSIQF